MTMFAQNHTTPDFTARDAWRAPDIGAYEKQKDLRIIRQQSDWLWSYGITSQVPSQPRLLGNGLMGKLWDWYYGPRLSAAKQGLTDSFPAFFPGHTVPGPGASANTRHVGTLAFDRFKKLLDLNGGLPKIGPLEGREPEHITTHVEQIDEWPWRFVDQPNLKVIHSARGQDTPDSMNTATTRKLLKWIEEQIHTYVEAGKTRETLSFVRQCWSPYTKEPVWSPETVNAARHLPQHADTHNLLQMVFEVEMIISHVQYSWPLNINGYGEYNGSWLEVGRLPITAIRCTELAVTERVLHELINVRTKGFAPIVVNEWGCDTDGTHRLIGSWMWNLLASLRKVKVTFDSDDVQGHVATFVNEHRVQMGEIVVREVLRSLEEILRNERMRNTLERDALPHVGKYYPITYLPVLLLPEYSCGAVIKGPYDDGVGCHRVDPRVYEMMAKDSSLTLPARGPYHLTDRAPLPWFKVLERR